MNILITSVGRRSYLVEYFKEVIKGEGKLYAANNFYTPSLSKADEYVLTPLIYDKGYVDFLLEYCKSKNISILISLFDIDLPILAMNKNKFTEAGILLIVPSPDVLKICNDKWETFHFLKNNNFPTPQTWLSPTLAMEAWQRKKVSSIIIKPRWGMGSIGIFEAFQPDEIALLGEVCRRRIQSSYLKYESQQTPDDCVIYQEYLEGQEYGMDVVNDLQGSHRATWMRKKLAMRAGETDEAEIVDLPLLRQLASGLSVLGHIGNLDVDVIERNGKFYVIDMNARFGGGYPFSHLAGANLPLALVAWAQGKEPEKNWKEIKIGAVGYKEILPVPFPFQAI